MTYQFADLIGRSRWLMERSAMKRLLIAAHQVTSDSIAAAAERYAALPARVANPEMMGDVAVINVSGPITYRESFFSYFFGGATVERMQAQFRTALADPSVKAILFRVDSPGGTVDAVPEFASEIFRARGQKPIVAISDTLNASAALWISSQADQLLVAPSSQTGSIGVWMAHEDDSKLLEEMGVKITLIFAGKHKVEGNPFEPLPDDVRERYQAEVDEAHAEFIGAVARGRNVSAADVRKKYGQGLVYNAKESVSLGLADKVATFEGALAMAPKVKSGGKRADGELPPLAELLDDMAQIDGVVAEPATHIDEIHEHETREVLEAMTPAADTGAAAAQLENDLQADRDYADAGVRIAERL
jgi:signal peptide peptidase SppA